ncbi:MAG: hypothetical protein JWP81_1223 [Ferruginibacter sp.]|nr:hypothetical protein [Ferruginibacter sp.]
MNAFRPTQWKQGQGQFVRRLQWHRVRSIRDRKIDHTEGDFCKDYPRKNLKNTRLSGISLITLSLYG